MDIKKIEKGFLVPSALFTVPKSRLRLYRPVGGRPEVGDIVYASITRIGQHTTLENKFGRLRKMHNGTKAIFVFGNRYAPDFYEGLVPDKAVEEADILVGSGVIGIVKSKSSLVIDPTKVKILGYVCDEKGNKINSRDYSLISPRKSEKNFPRSKLILVCGTAMNSGKSTVAAACCFALSSFGFKVRASKVTGTASLRDILYMNDAGAYPINDFSYFGHPSTYKLEKGELLRIFNSIDLKYANNPRNYWVVEIADGINQRETAMLLGSDDVKSRISRLIFCAYDALGAIGGLRVLKEKFGLGPDIISGVCSSSPLHVKEIREFTSIPIVNSNAVDIAGLNRLLTGNEKKK
ncbi:hypothetical protein GF323_00685 [Candidatus Woesearchaeota archaeon]|nr:hypothetical protein [Candidatus Woesearchaeota archaeon]